MKYCVQKITDRNQIETCEKFSVDQYKWRCTYEPKVYGWMGYLPEEGLFVKMVCEESNPRRELQNHRDRVCDDSTMEIFLAFTEEGETLTNDSMYINFEINANAAMYSKTGKGRKGRQFITEEECELTGCKTTVEEDKWSLEVLFPESFLKKHCDFESVKNGKTFYCNFYKISETAEIEHYGSFAPIGTETPNFHVPVFFAEAVIV